MKTIFIILLCQVILFHGYLSASLALVFSGGGVRSIYQIGVWKALIQLGVEIDGVFGSSAGAINAAAVASREYEAALQFWRELEIGTVFNVSEKTSELLKKGFSEWKFLEALSLAREVIDSRGIDSGPLGALLEKVLDEERIRTSGIDMGIVVYSLSHMKPLELLLEDIPEGQLAEFVSASANFPLFKRVEIDSQIYIDGGIYNNVPVNMAIERGYREIILVDLHYRRLKDFFDIWCAHDNEEIELTVISPQHDYVDLFEFNRSDLTKTLVQGYLDTYSAMGKIFSGYTYISSSTGDFRKRFMSLRADQKRKALGLLGVGETGEDGEQMWKNLEKYMERSGSDVETVFLKILDRFASLLRLERLHLYDTDELLGIISGEVDDDRAVNGSYNNREYMEMVRFLRYIHENTRGDVSSLELWSLISNTAESLSDGSGVLN
jgi:NTE family protein